VVNLQFMLSTPSICWLDAKKMTQLLAPILSVYWHFRQRIFQSCMLRRQKVEFCTRLLLGHRVEKTMPIRPNSETQT
jgi:hypothetical protein